MLYVLIGKHMGSCWKHFPFGGMICYVDQCGGDVDVFNIFIIAMGSHIMLTRGGK
jgi:hypothetical protein